jgi:flavin-binding protein dodecin
MLTLSRRTAAIRNERRTDFVISPVWGAGVMCPVGSRAAGLHTAALAAHRQSTTREAKMAVASVSKITAASPTSFDAAIQEGLSRASKTLRGITGLHVIEEKASVSNGKIAEYRVTMELTFILEG